MIYKSLRYGFFFTLTTILFGCPRQDNSKPIDVDTKTITKHDSDGNLILEGKKSKSTGKGIFKFYYPDGTLKKIQEVIKDSIEHGTYKYYYPSGELKDSAQLTYGKFHGSRYRYFETGTLREKTNYINNKIRNEVLYDTASNLKEYRAHDYDEKIAFVAKYSNNTYKHLSPDEIHLNDLIHSFVLEDSFPIGKPFSVELLVGHPPLFETSVSVGYRYKSETETKEIVSDKPDRFNRINYTITQNPQKDIEIIHVAKAINNNNVIIDTLIIEVNKEGVTSYNYGK